MRRLVRQPWGLWVVAGVLGGAVGLAAIVIAVSRAAVLHALPVPAPDRLVSFGGLAYGTGIDDPASFWGQAEGLESLTFYRVGDLPAVWGSAADVEWLRVAEVSGGFFQVFRTEPLLGRGLTREDEFLSRDVAVVSYRLWTTRLGADANVLQQQLRLAGRSYAISGVAPPGFNLPNAAQVWIPRAAHANLRPVLTEGSGDLPALRRKTGWVGRLGDGWTLPQIRSQLEGLLAYANETISPRSGVRYGDMIGASPLAPGLIDPIRPTVRALLFGVGAVLLIAIVNCILFALTLVTQRWKELAIRQALGASQARLARQLAGEALVVGIIAGLAGFLVALLLQPVARDSLLPFGIELRNAPGLFTTVFAVAMALATAAALGASAVIAIGLRGFAPDSVNLGPSATRATPGLRTVRAGFVAAQIAAAVLLAAGALLTVITLRNMTPADQGRELSQVVVARLGIMAAHAAATGTAVRERELIDLASALPGIRSAAVVSALPIEGRDRGYQQVMSGDSRLMAATVAVRGDYFPTMGTRLTQGRSLEDGEPGGVVMNATLAAALFPDGEALGAAVQVAGGSVEVIGVSEDTRAVDERTSGVPELYVALRSETPHPHSPPVTRVLVARCEGPCGGVTASLHAALADPPGLFIYSVTAGGDLARRASAPARMRAAWWLVYAALALGVALAGLATLVSHSIASRAHEFGIRMVLGATRAGVIRLVLRQAAASVVLGLMAGVIASRWLTAVFAGVLVDVQPLDIRVLGAVLIGVLMASAVAAILPALTTSRHAPALLLKRE
jgi:putative ABC transport system permease protein